MADFEARTTVDASPEALFDYLSDVSNLPSYFAQMTSARQVSGEQVHTTATLPDGSKVEGEAWFRVDQDARSLQWGSVGASSYRGELSVDGEGDRATVEVTLHAPRAEPEDEDVRTGLQDTLAAVKRLVEERAAG